MFKERYKLFVDLEDLSIYLESCYNKFCDISRTSQEDELLIEETRQKINKLRHKIREFNQKISLLDKEYEITLSSYGFKLGDRNIDDKLYAFMNNVKIE